jgi:inosose dehydratase
MENLAVSPCSNPEMGLDEVLAAYSEIGFRKFEVFTSWAKSAFDYHGDPESYRAKGREHGMEFVSMHLPAVGDDLEVGEAVTAARFAAAVGAGVVLFKATSRPNYIQAAGPFLDAVEELPLTPVLQNHAGTPISTPDDFREVIEGIDDPRMRALLEVGHFHTVGVSWREGCELLGGRIALVHIKDQVGGQSVPFGQGEVDLPGLFAHMREAGYDGDFVVEMEVQDRENTLRYLREARRYVQEHCMHQ